jgi:thiol-disulfide isomerase/thioredoxin
MAKWLLLLSMLLARPAFAGDGLDVRDWLSRPGVKLLAVEFYASWCGPCKKAVPQWKALHEKYRDQGLRLVVVSVQDPDGACVNPGWNPDDVVCDTEGHLAEAWGVGDKLPAAFLWSWRGPLLVRKGHVQEVERQVEDELARLPRVTLDEGMEGHVRELLRTELARSGKVDVVAGADEEKALAEIRRTSHELQFSDRSACKLGQRLAANSLLKASFVKAGSGKRLLVQLFSAETGCLNGSAGVFWNLERPEMSVAEATAELVNNLRVAVELPGGSVRRTIEERNIGEKGEAWSMDIQTGVLVSFESEPSGAVVLVDGRLQCPGTPCSKTLAGGSHKVEMQKESYVPETTSISVGQGMKPVRLTLTPDFGWLTVASEPKGLPVQVDGKQVGTTPLSRHQVSTGPHEVLVSDPRYYDSGKQVQVDRGETEEIRVELIPREGGLVVNARDERGNDLAAEVWLDDTRVGTTPLAKQVLIGRHKLKVVHGGRQVEQDVEVKEKQVENIAVELKGGAGKSGSSGGVGTWTDQKSGLTWQVTPTGGTMTWVKAKAHCTGLSLDGGGWHLPTIGELRSLIRGCPATQAGGSCNIKEGQCVKWSCRDDSCSGCSNKGGPADGCYWPDNMQGTCSWYWSSSPVEDVGGGAWRVGFGYGLVSHYGVHVDLHVRCVR